jgi:hypothetical protein
VYVETKEQSKEWMHTHSPNKLKKFKQTSTRKLRATVFWAMKGVLMVKFMQQGTTITSEVYCKTVKTCIGPFRMKGAECPHPVYCSSITMSVHIELLALEHCWRLLKCIWKHYDLLFLMGPLCYLRLYKYIAFQDMQAM